MKALSVKDHINAAMQDIFPADAPGAALLAVKEGKVIIREGYGMARPEAGEKISPATNFRMASVSKQFTAVSLLLLAEKRKLSPDDPLKDFFPDLPAALQRITVRQLLTHTSGIVDYETLIPPGQIIQVQDEDVLQWVKQKGSVYFPPGTKFKYSNTGYCLLALIVRQASGIPYAAFIRKNIFEPLQMDHSLVYEKGKDIQHRAFGYHPEEGKYHRADQGVTSATRGDGGVYTSLDDYEKWNEALEKNRLLSKEWMDRIFSGHAVVNDQVGYGYGWFTGKEADGTACQFHSGESTGFHNMVYRNPEKNLLIALFSNRDDGAAAKVFDRVAGLLDVRTAFPHESNQLLVQWLGSIYGD